MTDRDIGVVIPTTEPTDAVRTLDSIPAGVDETIEREGSLNEARNRGVRSLDTDYVAILDDDLSFPEQLITELASRADRDTLLGLADWDFGLIAGRMMVFHRDLWSDVGGFDEQLKSHMGDTEFALAAVRKDYELERLPREVIHHEPHDRSITTTDRVWRVGYLTAKYPTESSRIIGGMLP